jgi:hypothetical protein
LADSSTLDLSQVQDLATANAQQIVEAIPQGEAFSWLEAMTGESARALTDTLYQTHNIQIVWYVMGGVGIISAFGIFLYGQWILKSPIRERV